MTPKRMTRINFYVPDPALAKLRALADAQGVPLSELIRRAIDAYVKRQKAPSNKES